MPSTVALPLLSLIILTLLMNAAGIRPVVKSPAFGGPGGTAFDDYVGQLQNLIFGVRKLNISHGDAIDSIQATYLLSNKSLYLAPKHGGHSDSDPPSIVEMGIAEYIYKIHIKTDGHSINQITLTTYSVDEKRGAVFGPYGKNDGADFTFEGYLVGFYGRVDNLVRYMGIYMLAPVKESNLFGGPGGDKFDEHPDRIYPPVIKINKIFIRHGDSIDSIQMEYLLLDNTTQMGDMHGGPGGNLSTIELDYMEEITRIEGETKGLYIDQLAIITKKSDGTEKHYGPFGKGGKEYFSFNENNIIGIVGFSENFINSISVYYS